MSEHEAEYGVEFERRVAQFHRYLETMHRRSHTVAEGFCFMVFKENSSGEGDGRTRKAAKDRERIRERVRERTLVSVAGKPGETGVFMPDEWPALDGLDSEMDEEYPFNRYVQFGFEEDRFLMDLPLGTLFMDEADDISARRSGFSWARQNGNPALSEKDIEDFDPLQKFYRYGDERTAAEDAAFIFFEVWGIPANSRLFVSASSCHTPHSWERGEPFE